MIGGTETGAIEIFSCGGVEKVHMGGGGVRKGRRGKGV